MPGLPRADQLVVTALPLGEELVAACLTGADVLIVQTLGEGDDPGGAGAASGPGQGESTDGGGVGVATLRCRRAAASRSAASARSVAWAMRAWASCSAWSRRARRGGDLLVLLGACCRPDGAVASPAPALPARTLSSARLSSS